MQLPMTACIGPLQAVAVSHLLRVTVQWHLHKLHQARVSSGRDSAHRHHTLAGNSPASLGREHCAATASTALRPRASDTSRKLLIYQFMISLSQLASYAMTVMQIGVVQSTAYTGG